MKLPSSELINRMMADQAKSDSSNCSTRGTILLKGAFYRRKMRQIQNNPRPLPDEITRPLIEEMKAEGLSLKRIAVLCGVSLKTLQNFISSSSP